MRNWLRETNQAYPLGLFSSRVTKKGKQNKMKKKTWRHYRPTESKNYLAAFAGLRLLGLHHKSGTARWHPPYPPVLDSMMDLKTILVIHSSSSFASLQFHAHNYLFFHVVLFYRTRWRRLHVTSTPLSSTLFASHLHSLRCFVRGNKERNKSFHNT